MGLNGSVSDPVRTGTQEEGWWAAVMADTEVARMPTGGRTAGRGAGDGAAWQSDALNAARSETLAAQPPDWEKVRQIYEADETLELKVVGFNRGGLLVALETLRGFVPVSHLIGLPVPSDEEARKTALARRVGDTLRLKVIEHDEEKGRIVLSERAALAGPGRRTELLTRLQPGDTVRGVVTNLTHFGAFVDLGGVEGLIHVSEMSWGRVDHPADVLTCGEETSVCVLSVDRQQARVALSLRRLKPDPWATVEERYVIGQLVNGIITNVVDFGAFACIEDGLEGLIHVSELAEGNFMHPRNVVREGESVSARILTIDGSHRRLGLSLRRVSHHGEEGAAAS